MKRDYKNGIPDIELIVGEERYNLGTPGQKRLIICKDQVHLIDEDTNGYDNAIVEIHYSKLANPEETTNGKEWKHLYFGSLGILPLNEISITGNKQGFNKMPLEMSYPGGFKLIEIGKVRLTNPREYGEQGEYDAILEFSLGAEYSELIDLEHARSISHQPSFWSNMITGSLSELDFYSEKYFTRFSFKAHSKGFPKGSLDSLRSILQI